MHRFPFSLSYLCRSHFPKGVLRSGGRALGRATTVLDAHGQAVARAKSNREKGHDRGIGKKSEAIPLSDCREQQRRLHHREAGADADARASAKGKIRKTWNAAAFDGIDAPALGIKSLGIREEAWIVMGEPLKNENVGARANAVASDLNIADCAPADSPSRGIKAQRFLNHHFGIRKAGEIRETGRASGKHLIELGDERLLDRGVLCEEIPGPGEGVRSRFVAGEEEGHDLVAELNIAHSRAMLVLSIEKSLQQVL